RWRWWGFFLVGRFQVVGRKQEVRHYVFEPRKSGQLRIKAVEVAVCSRRDQISPGADILVDTDRGQCLVGGVSQLGLHQFALGSPQQLVGVGGCDAAEPRDINLHDILV